MGGGHVESLASSHHHPHNLLDNIMMIDDDLRQPSEWDDEQSSTHFTEKTGEEGARVKISTDISSLDILFAKYFKKNSSVCSTYCLPLFEGCHVFCCSHD